jgi:hypothetical protein
MSDEEKPLPFPAIIFDGVPRFLATLPPHPDFGGLARYSRVEDMIPRNLWEDASFGDPFKVPVFDQGASLI